jgi:hypothetical protein
MASKRNSLLFQNDPEGDARGENAARGWVGAFERVLGDQAEALSQERWQRQQQQQQLQIKQNEAAESAGTGSLEAQDRASKVSRGNGGGTEAGSGNNSGGDNTPGLLQPQSHFLVEDSRPSKIDRPGSSVSRASSVHSSASLRPVSDIDARTDPTHESANSEGPYLLPKAALASRSASEAGTDPSEPSAGQTPQNVFRPIPRQAQCTDAACSGNPDPYEDFATTMQTSTTGPSLVTLLGPPNVIMEDLYLNHAPGLQKLCLSNLTHSKVQVRLDSDIGDAISFMRSKASTESPGM